MRPEIKDFIPLEDMFYFPQLKYKPDSKNNKYSLDLKLTEFFQLFDNDIDKISQVLDNTIIKPGKKYLIELAIKETEITLEDIKNHTVKELEIEEAYDQLEPKDIVPDFVTDPSKRDILMEFISEDIESFCKRQEFNKKWENLRK